ncbi:glycosyltransferase [Leptospira levettii]|uniref:glycosyltransferase n=1 Tax=Leptospira levettii TaxID=2023178 RepID=UPI00223D65AE|nr:glycosyltransferase [Leptospira levettii]MCW7497039.1 glycosyltransferase [Leptospira levettii]
MIIGIDASRNKSGGAVAHIVGILKHFDISKHNIEKVHLWSYLKLLDQIPDYPWLVKHSPRLVSFNILAQLFWQRFLLKKEAESFGCSVMFDTDAGSVSKFRPYVTMSQDLLKFEKGSQKYYRLGLARLRLFLLYFIQIASFRNSNGTIFLTEYSSKVIQEHTGKLKRIKIIPHGIDVTFNEKVNLRESLVNSNIKLLYVSPIQEYKNHIPVMKAIHLLYQWNSNVNITFTGDNSSDFAAEVIKFSKELDPSGRFIHFVGNIQHSSLAEYSRLFDIVVFASSIENMPITLMESMRLGMPIACSNRGPMKDVLRDSGVYFDPEIPDDIFNAIKLIIANNELRFQLAEKARKYSMDYSWEKCSEETFSFLTSSIIY